MTVDIIRDDPRLRWLAGGRGFDWLYCAAVAITLPLTLNCLFTVYLV